MPVLEWREAARADLLANVEIVDYHLEAGAMARPSIHPGEILADELQEIGVTPTELSRQIDVPANRITQIIHGITGDTALRLGHWFGTSAQFWLNLQSAYDIRVAREKAGREIAKLPVRRDVGIGTPQKP